MRGLDPYTMDRARPGVGSLGSDERHGLPPQALGARLPSVSTADSTRSFGPGHAEARHRCRDCPVRIPIDRLLCYFCKGTVRRG